MRSSAQLKDSHIRPFVHAPHSDRVHESRGFFQSVCFKRDVPYPEWGPKILVTHLLPPGEALAPNDQIERRCNSPTQNEGSSSRSSTLPLASRRCNLRSLEPIVRSQERVDVDLPQGSRTAR